MTPQETAELQKYVQEERDDGYTTAIIAGFMWISRSVLSKAMKGDKIKPMSIDRIRMYLAKKRKSA